MKAAASIVAIVLATAAGACAHHNQTSAQAPAPTVAGAQASTCALAQVPDVHASVADINDGVAITFTGPHKQLDQLRSAVHAMKDAQDKQGDAFAACPCSSGTYAAGAAEAMPGAAGAPTGQRIGANANVDDISTGAVLKLTAKNKNEVQALRDETRQGVHALRDNCLGHASRQGQQPYGGQQQYNQQP